MKNILVAGGNGYVGSNIIKYALRENFQVTSVSRRG
jgi:nucleoside-diphosphate-sugar epimerase